MSYLYTDGLPFYTDKILNRLKRDLDKIFDRVKYNNLPAIILIEGPSGMGKSTLMTHILDYYHKKAFNSEIDLKDRIQLSTGMRDFEVKLRECYEKGFESCGYDEAGDYSKRGSLTKLNRDMNRKVETMRAFKIIGIISLPYFNVLDNYLFDQQIIVSMFRCYGKKQNNQFPDKGYSKFKAYSSYRIGLLRHYIKKYGKAVGYKMVTPNYHGTFKDLPPERSQLLNKISTDIKLNINLASEMGSRGLITKNQIATQYGYSTSRITHILLKYKVLPAKNISGKNYYDNKTLRVIEDHINENKLKRGGIK